MSLERTAIPRELSSPRRFTRRFRVIVGLVAFAAVSGPVGCVAALANRPQEAVAVAVPRHAGVAAAVAESYLDGHPLPVAVASGLPVTAGRGPAAGGGGAPGDGAGPAPIPHRWLVPLAAEVRSVPAGAGASRTVETHRFLVGTDTGAFVLAVPLVETAAGAPALGAVPAIEPHGADPAAAGLAPLDWEAVTATARPTAALRARIAEWAAAYAADDRRRLHEITGDGRTGVVYPGLGSWGLVGEPAVGGVLDRADGLAACRVELTLVAVSDSAVTTTVAYDLLVAGPSDAVPAVVGWGSPGTALVLRPYGNAGPAAGPGAAPTTTTAPAPPPSAPPSAPEAPAGPGAAPPAAGAGAPATEGGG